jgi:hypothetical protein
MEKTNMTTHNGSIIELHGLVIHTSYDPKPIPIRGYDWSAVLDGYDGGDEETGGDPCGWGRTENMAIAELLEQLADLANDEELRRAVETGEINAP